jgi:hypothetical protein
MRPRRLLGASGRPLNFPFLKERFPNSILTPRCRFGTRKSLTFVRRHGIERFRSGRARRCSTKHDGRLGSGGTRYTPARTASLRNAALGLWSPQPAPMLDRARAPTFKHRYCLLCRWVWTRNPLGTRLVVGAPQHGGRFVLVPVA